MSGFEIGQTVYIVLGPTRELDHPGRERLSLPLQEQSRLAQMEEF
jgi:hypothetical protein